MVAFCFGRKDNVMRKDKTRAKKAMDIALEQLDYIMDYYAALDFVEVTERVGGDDDSGAEPARVKRAVWANFFGTLICDQQLPLDENKVLWLQDRDFVWL